MNIHNIGKKRFGLLLAVGVLAFSGCGKNDRKALALITDGGSVEDQSTNQSAWEGIQKFAGENEKTSAYYQPSGQSDKAYEEAIQEALKAGAEVIVCPGSVFETAVYDMQKEDLSVKYILLDGVPHARDSDKEKLRGNTHAVLFAQEQAGFLAGYAAVKEGYTGLGFLGGEEDEDSVRYGSGFVQGANAAAAEMALDPGLVTLRYGFTGSNLASPAVAQKAGSWYDEGCQVIFGNDPSILTSVGKAASDRGKLVISAESSLGVFSDRVLTYVGRNYAEIVYQTLQSIKEKEYRGGEKETVGIREGGIYLDMSRSAFGTFTEEQYQAVTGQIKSEKITVSEENVTKDLKKYGIENITVNMEN